MGTDWEVVASGACMSEGQAENRTLNGTLGSCGWEPQVPLFGTL